MYLTDELSHPMVPCVRSNQWFSCMLYVGHSHAMTRPLDSLQRHLINTEKKLIKALYWEDSMLFLISSENNSPWPKARLRSHWSALSMLFAQIPLLFKEMRGEQISLERLFLDCSNVSAAEESKSSYKPPTCTWVISSQ